MIPKGLWALQIRIEENLTGGNHPKVASEKSFENKARVCFHERSPFHESIVSREKIKTRAALVENVTETRRLILHVRVACVIQCTLRIKVINRAGCWKESDDAIHITIRWLLIQRIDTEARKKKGSARTILKRPLEAAHIWGSGSQGLI